MGLISKTVFTRWNGNNKQWYIEKGYIFTKHNDILEVNIEDLPDKSNIYVEVKCDCLDCKEPHLKLVRWADYKSCVDKNNAYYCIKCAQKLYGFKNLSNALLVKNKISFEDWCIQNNHLDVLERFDVQLNNYKPNEICFSTHKKYYFKCPKGIHESELKNINSFICGKYSGTIECKQCNSFGQWGIDNICEDFLDKYWDYENNTIDPWKISYGNSINKVWIKCQEKDYHGSYDVVPFSFTNMNTRCPYCTNRNGKVHPKDSLGQYIIDNFGESFLNNVWSDKNKKSAFKYAPHASKEKVYWKCFDGIHKDFKRKISESNIAFFRCPECGNYSKGEERISKYLINKNINYIPQKTFDGLIGLGGGLLSYDFYLLEKYNLLVEYDGEFHFELIKLYKNEPKELAEARLEKQKEHDRLKDEYAKNNGIKLLRIPYWEFDNIELILEKELRIQK